MKKIILAVVIVLGMATYAFAAGATHSGGGAKGGGIPHAAVKPVPHTNSNPTHATPYRPQYNNNYRHDYDRNNHWRGNYRSYYTRPYYYAPYPLGVWYNAPYYWWYDFATGVLYYYYPGVGWVPQNGYGF